MRRTRRAVLARRLGRLEEAVSPRGLRDSEWLTDPEFEELYELLRSGLTVEAEGGRLLATARARRVRGERRPNELWRVDVIEGRL